MIEMTSRYGDALPDPATMCPGECEGMGYVPIMANDLTEPWHTLWLETEAITPTDDGSHFVQCPDCHGTGKQA